MESDEMHQLEAKIATLEMSLEELKKARGQDMSPYGSHEMAGEDFIMMAGCVGTAENTGMFAWDEKKRQIREGVVMVGRKAWSVAPSAEDLEDGRWYVRVEMTGGYPYPELYRAALGVTKNPTDTLTYLPLYEIEDGKIRKDLRGCFTVQCWE